MSIDHCRLSQSLCSTLVAAARHLTYAPPECRHTEQDAPAEQTLLWKIGINSTVHVPRVSQGSQVHSITPESRYVHSTLCIGMGPNTIRKCL